MEGQGIILTLLFNMEGEIENCKEMRREEKWLENVRQRQRERRSEG